MAKLSHKKINRYINMTSVYSNVLSPTEVRYLNDLPEVVSAKASLATRSSGTVRFSVTVTDAIRIALKAHFDLDVPSGSSIPMRWIKGDTEPHMDTGASKFANTYLVYLTSSPGSLIVDSQTYPIEANTGIVFNEGLTHATEGTGHSPRLLLGPMNEHAEPVGTPTTLQIPVNHLTLSGSAVDIGSAAATPTTSTDPGTLEYVTYEGRNGIHITSDVAQSPHISIPNTFSDSSSFSISFWLHHGVQSSAWIPLITLVGGVFFINIAFYNDGSNYHTYIAIGVPGDNVAMSANWGYSSWAHIALNYYANGYFNLYINGIYNTQVQYVNPFTCSELVIGGLQSVIHGTGVPWEGHISQVYVFDHWLADTQIAGLYNPSTTYYPTEADALADTNSLGNGISFIVGDGGPFGSSTSWSIASNSTGSSSQSAVYTNETTLNDDGIYYLYPYGSGSAYTLSMPRRWFSIVQDGNGGEAGRAYGSMGQFISANTSVDANGRTSLTAIYIDQTHNTVRQLFGRSPDTNAQELFSLGLFSGPLNQLILNGSAVDIGSAAATVTNVGSVGFSEYAGLTGAEIVANNPDMYLQIPFTNNTAFTVSYWVYNSGGPSGWTQTMAIVGGDGNMGIAVHPDNYMYIMGFGSNSNDLGAVSSNGWHQFTITYGSGIFTLYVDNVQRGTFNHTYSLANEYICFGQTNFNAWFTSSHFNGNIRQICIFDSVLTSVQMTALYNGTQGNEVLQGGPIRSFVGYSNLATSEYFTYYVVNDTLYSESNASGASWPLLLTDINTPATNVKLRKCCVGTTHLIYISVGNSIYSVWYDSGLYTQLIADDYSGHDYHVASEDGNTLFICYTTNDYVKLVQFTNTGGSGGGVSTFIGALRYEHMNPNCQPRVVVKNGTPSLFVIKNKMLCSTTIIPSNPVITVSPMIVHVKSYMPIATSSGVFIIGINHFNKLFEFAHSPPSPPKFIILDNRTVANNVFDVCTINDEQYIFYQDSNGFVRQLWNPINRINITFTAPITSIEAAITGVTGSALHPAFDPAISDYGLQTEAQTSTVTYNLSIVQASGTTNISELAFPNQLLAISDANATYYIRLHPSSTLYGTSNILSADYNPGYYLAADTYGSGSPYFSIYDSQGVPVWYRRVTSDPDFLNIGSMCAFQKGNGKNRAITLIFDFNRPRTVIDIATLEEGNYISLPPSGGGPPLGWEVHESLELDGPPNRRGNILHAMYVNGFYLQEQNTDHELVWDFYSTSAWAQSDPEWFHINAMSVHPVTGNIICSFRTNCAIACINYATKNVDWVIDPTNGCWQYLNDTSLTKNLSIQGEPNILGNQYNGTNAQHDCRWHPEIAPLTAGNQVISIYDNQSFSGWTPRGVIYEIDLTNDLCIWRGNSYSEGGSGYMGSYRINYEANGTTSHVVDFVQQHPPLREYSGASDGMPTQNTVFTMDFPGDWYRFDKATPNQMDIVAMRRTAGMPYSTPFDPPTPWTPVGSPNIRVWFDGNDIMADGTVFSDGIVNTGWNDKSGNASNASGGTGNTYTTKTNIQNGLSVQRMTATPGGLGAHVDFLGCGSYTIFSAQRNLGSAGDWALFLNGYNGSTMDGILYYGRHENTTNLFATSDDTRLEEDTPAVNLSNWCVLSATFEGSTNQVYANGVAVDPRTNVTVYELSGIYIGSLYNGGQMWDGDIGDIIIYNGVLSTGDRQKVEGFLAWKWGLQSNLPSGHPYKSAAPTA